MEIDEGEIAEVQAKTGVLNVKQAVAYCLKVRDSARAGQLRRELMQLAARLAPLASDKNVSARRRK